MRKKGVMNKLPDEIVLSILSRLPFNEVARAGVVSRKWYNYWRHTPVLNFDNPVAFNNMVKDALEILENYPNVIKERRIDYLNWVNNVLLNHLGCIIDEFKLVFYINMTHQRVIDIWVPWVFSKNVKRFELDFTPPLVTYAMGHPFKNLYVLDGPILKSCNTKFHLTSLCLKCVDVTTQAMECFLNTCGPTLENLYIERSNVLTRIADASLPSLKYFKLYGCPNVETFHIKAPKLVSFVYFSGYYPVLKLFNIENASMLTSLSVKVFDEERFLNVLRSLFKYFSHLEFLKLSWFSDDTIRPALDNFPALANLKHLKLFTILPDERTLAAWVPFIVACPLLHKLTLKLHGRLLPVWPKIVNHDKLPLLCLKTLEFKKFNGYNVDLDLANFLLQNATALQELIVYTSEASLLPLNKEAPLSGVGLTLPPHVNLVVF